MAKKSTLGSPGVEVHENDNSTRVSASTSCTVFVPGYAAQGPVEEVINIGDMEEFVNVYGEPTNAAERYFYYTVKTLCENSGNGTTIMTSRLPYGSGKGDTVSTAYTLLSYPAVPVIPNPNNNKGYDYIELVNSKRRDDLKGIFALYKRGGESSGQPDTNIEISSISYDILTTGENVGDGNAFVDQRDDEMLDKTFLLHGITTNGSGLAALSTDPLTIKTKYAFNYSGEYLAGESEGKLYTEQKKDGSLVVRIIGSFCDTDGVSSEQRASYRFTITYKKKVDDGIGIDPNKYAYEYKTKADGDNEYTCKGEYVKAFITSETYDGKLKAEDVSAITEEAQSSAYFKAHFTKKHNEETDVDDIYSKDVTYLLGNPATFQVSLSEYYKIISGEAFKWSNEPYSFKEVPSQEARKSGSVIEDGDKIFGIYEAIKHSAFIMLNTIRSTINDKFEGFYIGMSDNMFTKPSTKYTFDAVSEVKITTETVKQNKESLDNPNLDWHKGLLDNADTSFDSLSGMRLGFPLVGDLSGSVSRVLERELTSMDTSTTEYDDTLSIGLFKLTKSTTNAQTLKLSYTLRENFNAALGKTRIKSTKLATKPVSYFIENIITDSSNNIGIMVNPFISKTIATDVEGNLRGKVRVYGNKLVNNLNMFENGYTLRENSIVPQKGIDLFVLADTLFNSYADIIKQAGVSPYYIQRHIVNKEGDVNFLQCNAMYPIGTYTTITNTSKIIGNLPYKLERALQLVENDEEYPDCDIVVDGGLSTIYAYSNGGETIGENSSLSSTLVADHEINYFSNEEDETLNKQTQFDDTVIFAGVEDLRTGKTSLTENAQIIVEDWRAVTETFLQFCSSQADGGRGDSFFIGDVLRGALIKGRNTKVCDLYGTTLENSAYNEGETINHSWTTSVYEPIHHLTDTTVSSYASMYAQWFKIDDVYSGDKVWVPSSPYVAALMAATDQNQGPWYAAAGYTRGIIRGVIDYAVNPTVKQRTDLYKICINSIPKMPSSGLTVWGIRTMSKKDSCFDQNTCRRTFLYMEKYLKRYLRYYVFEPNTTYTRLAIYNEIEPFMRGLLAQDAIYSYTVVCDTTNNDADVINNGDLVVDVSAAPTRTAENIILNVTANKYTNSTSVSSSI